MTLFVSMPEGKLNKNTMHILSCHKFTDRIDIGIHLEAKPNLLTSPALVADIHPRGWVVNGEDYRKSWRDVKLCGFPLDCIPFGLRNRLAINYHALSLTPSPFPEVLHLVRGVFRNIRRETREWFKILSGFYARELDLCIHELGITSLVNVRAFQL